MAGTKYQVRTYGNNLVAAHLRALARRADNLRPVWPAVTRRAAAGYERSFDREGPGWAPLAPRTVRRRIKEGYGGTSPILVRTESYKDNLTDAENLFVVEDGDSLVIHATHDLFPIHQFGYSKGKRKLPARPVKISQGDAYWMAVEIDHALMEGYWER